MRKVIKGIMWFLLRWGYAIYIGVALGWLGVSFNNWRFYVVIIPLGLLVEWMGGMRFEEGRKENT